MQQLAEYGASKKSSQLRSLYPARKLASLFAIVHTYAAIAVDEFFEMFVILMYQFLPATERDTKQNFLGSLSELDRAALQLATVCDIIVEDRISDPSIKPDAFVLV